MINWNNIIKKEKQKEYFIKLKKFLIKEYNNKIILPPKNKIFESFKLTPFKKIKIVILGQDPYSKINQSHGLAFSILPNIKIIPGSLKNIYKELKKENPKFKIPNTGYLKKWSEQGILLLNTVLTVQNKKPGSHKNIGWEIFTNNIIYYINTYLTNIVFMLWGNYAKSKEKLINKNKHLILTTSHPSPLSVNKGFIGCNHFNKANIFLKNKKKKIINWQI